MWTGIINFFLINGVSLSIFILCQRMPTTVRAVGCTRLRCARRGKGRGRVRGKGLGGVRGGGISYIHKALHF